MKPLILVATLFLSGCAQVQTAAESESLFIACKSMDVITTAIGLNSGHFHETNPALKLLIGPHNLFPLIGFSVAVWAILHYINEPKAWLVANTVTCSVAARNAVLLHSAGVIH